MNGVIHLLIGSLGAAFSLLILRADPARHDNRAFAVLGMLDATMTLFRGIAGVFGSNIAAATIIYPCALLAPFLAWASLEFAWSFPFNRPLPWRWRLPILIFTAAAVTVMAAGKSVAASNLANTAFFIPATALMVYWLARNVRRVEGDRFGARLVFAALLLRWLTANALYSVYGHIAPETWSVLLWFESTVVVLMSFVMIGLANVRSNLFTMRSALGELVLESAFFLTAMVLTAIAVLGALALRERWPVIGVALLMLSALIPLGVHVVTNQLRPRLEAGVDPRKARRREVLDAAVTSEAASPAEVEAEAAAALAAVSEGGAARFVAAGALDAADRAALAAGPRRDRARLLVPVRSGGRLHGALAVDGGVLDRETVHAAGVLADRLAAACELRRMAGELEDKSRLAALGAFAAAIAHDIRTPLTSVQLNVQMLRRKLTLPADDMEHLDIAIAELYRLDDHVKQLLDYAKPLALHRETVEVKDVADAAARTIEPLLGERGQVLTRDHAEAVPPVAVDPTRLRQVLWNLLDNAAKASPPGATIGLRTRAQGDQVAIDVIDHGTGIAAGDLDRVFEPFFTTRPDGTGLGLAICQKVVRGHGGEIAVRSEPAQGSTFTVVLPAA